MSMAERKTMTRAVKNPVKRKLTRAEKKEIAAVIQAAKGDGKSRTAQQTIPYLQMYPDGICRVTEKKYSKSLVFEDINYQLAQADDKTAIFENWCDFLNYFDASVSVQLSFINQGARKEKAQAAIEIPAQDDAFNSIRREYADMLPFISGDELIRTIRKFSNVPVIVVSAKSLTFNKVELFRLGADDYLTKPFDLDELLARIERNLLRSQKCTPNLCLKFGELSIDTASKIVTVADEIIVLTAKEYQLLELLAKYPDKVFSKQNLYESIWQEPFARDNDVINTHISNLRKKLRSEGCRIKTVWGLGYRFAK